MTIEYHDLYHEFPEFKHRIAELRRNNANFAAKMTEYDLLDTEIRLSESNVEPHPDDLIEAKKFQRVQLKDELYAWLRKQPVN